MKFALLVGGLLAFVVLFWGWTISSLTRSSLEKQIIVDGADTLRMVARYGRLIIEGAEGATGKDIEALATKGSNLYDVVVTGTDAQGNKLTYSMRGHGRGYKLGVPEVIDISAGKDVTVARNLVVRERGAPLPVIDLSGYPIKGSKGAVIGSARVLISARRVERAVGNLWFSIVGAGILFLAVGVALSFLLASRIVRPAKILMEDMDRVAQGNYEHGTSATSGDELGRLADRFNNMTWALKLLREKEADVDSQLDAASEIQASLLPKKIPQLPGYDIFSYYLSAKEVGGDYYDFFPFDNERLAMVVADVSGKGIPGSMVMASTRMILRIVGPQCGLVGETMKATNKLIAQGIARGMFVTAMLAVLNVRSRELTVCSAGHNPMVLFRERTGRCELVNPAGIALGFDLGPIFNRTVKELAVRLEPGDRVVMYTDGVVEAMDERQEEYGEERFYEFVRTHARMRSKDFAFALARDLDEHKGAGEQHDDITISTFRVQS